MAALPRQAGRSNLAQNHYSIKLETEAGLFGRAGFEFTLNLSKSNLTVGADGRYEKFQFSTLGPAYPYLGVGISKPFFRMDLLLNPASWSSAFVGPAVSRVMVSLTY